MKTAATIIFSIFVCSCASTPEVTELGNDTYMLTVSSIQEETRARDIALEEAYKYCTGMGGDIEVTDIQQKAAGSSTSAPATEVTFHCLNITIRPQADYPRSRGRQPADRPPVWPGK